MDDGKSDDSNGVRGGGVDGYSGDGDHNGDVQHDNQLVHGGDGDVKHDDQLANGGDGGHNLSQLELVEDGGLTSCIQTH